VHESPENYVVTNAGAHKHTKVHVRLELFVGSESNDSKKLMKVAAKLIRPTYWVRPKDFKKHLILFWSLFASEKTPQVHLMMMPPSATACIAHAENFRPTRESTLLNRQVSAKGYGENSPVTFQKFTNDFHQGWEYQ
jgi:hypothetical protein